MNTQENEVILFESEYQSIIKHEGIAAIEQRFKSLSESLFGQSYIDRMIELGNVLKQETLNTEKSCSKLIINTLDGGPTMEPEVQEWMHETFYPKLIEFGITTKAYCLGPEIIAKLSVELTAGDDPNQQFKFRFFETLEEGKEWLSKQI